MLIFPDFFDEDDRNFITSYEGGAYLPEGALIDGYVTVISYTNPQTGAQCWFGHQRTGGSVSTTVGLLEMMKWQVLCENHESE